MKSIDFKSMLIGGLIVLSAVLLMSNTPQDQPNKLEISGHPAGLFVFNKQTNQLFKYDFQFSGNLSPEPTRVFMISADGSNLVKE